MNQNTNRNGFDKNSAFSFLYRNRFKVNKGDTAIVNLSVCFMLLALLCAPWLVIIGVVAALLMGYRFAIEKNAADFSGSFETVVQNAAGNVKSVVDNFTQAGGETVSEEKVEE